MQERQTGNDYLSGNNGRKWVNVAPLTIMFPQPGLPGESPGLIASVSKHTETMCRVWQSETLPLPLYLQILAVETAGGGGEVHLHSIAYPVPGGLLTSSAALRED